MSNRAAKLLLEVAQHVELHAVRHPHSKMAGSTDLPVSPVLIDEIRAWAAGYREHIKRRQAAPRVPEKAPFNWILRPEVRLALAMVEREQPGYCEQLNKDIEEYYAGVEA